MKITLNGKETIINCAPDLPSILEAQGYAGKTVAVALNRDFLPRTNYAQTTIREGDEIDIVAPLQGG